jgi:hypothetical protein
LAKALGVPANSLRAQFHNVEHHRAHLASAFYVSPFRPRSAAFDRRFRRLCFYHVGRGSRELNKGPGPGRISALARHCLHRPRPSFSGFRITATRAK